MPKTDAEKREEITLSQEWTLQDNTNGKNGGYYRLLRNGKRVADFFPYATGADPKWVLEQAKLIAKVMNHRTISIEAGS